MIGDGRFGAPGVPVDRSKRPFAENMIRTQGLARLRWRARPTACGGDEDGRQGHVCARADQPSTAGTKTQLVLLPIHRRSETTLPGRSQILTELRSNGLSRPGSTQIDQSCGRHGLLLESIRMPRNADHWGQLGQEDVFPPCTSLELRPYRTHKPSWDHDHCIFCWAKLMDPELSEASCRAVEHDPEILSSGYTAGPVGGEWVCPGCFEEFAERLGRKSKTDPNGCHGESRNRRVGWG